MIREYLQSNSHLSTIQISNSAIKLLRDNKYEEHCVRIYDKSKIALAAAVGKTDLDTLTSKAQKALSYGIDYPAEPTSNAKFEHKDQQQPLDMDSSINFINQVLNTLKAEFPNLIFSGRSTNGHSSLSINNDLDLDLNSSTYNSNLSLAFQEVGKGNIVDGFVSTICPSVDTDTILSEFRKTLTAYSQPLEKIATGKQLIAFDGINLFAQTFGRNTNAQSYFSGSSMFANTLGQQRFADNFTLIDSRNVKRFHYVTPFDMEAVLREQADLPIIDKGKLTNVAANKLTALKYDCPVTASASGDLKSLPSSAWEHLYAEATSPLLADLMGDHDTIIMPYVVAGAQCTNAGDYAIPILSSFLVNKKGDLLGRLPACTLTGNLFDIFGKDYVGASEQRVSQCLYDNFVVTHMNVIT